MDLSFIADYISPIALVLCLCVGYVIKHLVPNEKVNRWIPLIAAALGVAVVAWATWSLTPETVVAGLVSGLASTGLYEAFRNLIGGE